jgi:hypothetical protein
MLRLVAFGNVVAMWRTERQQNVMPILKAGALYFALVFGAGFVLGTIRSLWIVPRLGTRMSELTETPIMLVIIILAARWIVRRPAVPSTPPQSACRRFMYSPRGYYAVSR